MSDGWKEFGIAVIIILALAAVAVFLYNYFRNGSFRRGFNAVVTWPFRKVRDAIRKVRDKYRYSRQLGGYGGYGYGYNPELRNYRLYSSDFGSW